jgi:hypothetical protein
MNRCRWRAWITSGAFAVLTAAGPSPGQPAGGPQEQGEPAEDVQQPTEIGVRFTPQIAGAMARRFTAGMQSKYELDEAQAGEIERLMQRQLLGFARKNAAAGRDMIELMMATMIAHDGRFPPEEAREFARLAEPFVPRLREFFTESSSEIGKRMSLGQRLKFTADVAVAATGLTVFESRMKRWKEGKVGDFANPFFDPADRDPARAEATPVDPREHADHRRARVDVELRTDRDLRIEEEWEKYLEQAVAYYGLDEAQQAAARAVLKDCRERARQVRSPAWRASIKENRIAMRLTRMAESDFANGPWGFALDSEFQRLRKPLSDLDEEFKKRLEALPTSAQRAAAREAVRKLLAQKGLEKLPV